MYWIDERKGHCVLLICGFGTGSVQEMERTYGKLAEEARKAYPFVPVRLALTSVKVIGRLHAGNGIRLPDVEGALEEIVNDFTGAGNALQIRMMTVQVVGGREYEKLVAAADTYSGKADIRLDQPLLAGPKLERLVDLLVEEAAAAPEEAILYVGHGTHGRDPEGPAAYRRLEEIIRSRGEENIFIGDLQTGIAPVISALAQKNYRRVRLCSLMMVSGHHWTVDVSGDYKDSWKNMLADEGYEVSLRKTGLLERREVRDLLIEGDRYHYKIIT